ncbi:hypothetical protein M3914_003170 [Vibrio metschnikovii]|nr:hypothetical protein [Vibrio metschnikovii]
MLLDYGIEAKINEFKCEFKIYIDSRELKVTTNWQLNGNFWAFIVHLDVENVRQSFEYFGESNDVYVALQLIQCKLNTKGKVFTFQAHDTKKLSSFLTICQMASFPKISPRKAISFA